MAELMEVISVNSRRDTSVKLYRFNEVNVEWLAGHFLGEREEKRGGALDSVKKMKVFLRFVGDPGFQQGLAKEENIHQTTVSRIIAEVAKIFLEKSNIWIKFPSTFEEFENAKDIWSNKYKFPCCIGAIDCTHVKIRKPSSHKDEYINRKGNFSINIQATCDANEQFTSVDVSWPGSVHDSRIFKNSELYTILQRNISNAVLLGDAGYGITPFLMVPYKNCVNTTQINFNKLLTKERVIIERCFGQLKMRFPCLQYKLRVSLEIIPAVIVSCFILHNVAKYLKDENVLEIPISYTAGEHDEENGVYAEEFASRMREQGTRRRNEICTLICNRNLIS